MKSHEFILKETQLDELISIRPQLKKKIDPIQPLGAPGKRGGDWYDILIGYGFSPIGGGAFGTVWGHPKFPYVLKIFKSNDDAYKSWVKVCMNNSDNPHFPKFVSTKVFSITPTVSAIRMEKLSPYISENYMGFSTVLNRLSISDIVNPNYQWNDAYGKPSQWDEYCASHPLWIPALKITDEFITSYQYAKDMHTGNFMMRGDDIVITDPVV